MATPSGPVPGPPGAAPPYRPALRLDSWAVKYGIASKGQFGLDKSGFSPIEYDLPSFRTTKDPEIAAIEKFQRGNMGGFTSAELGQLDCLPIRELTPGNLQNDIIPMLRRDRWERVPAQPDLTRDHMYPLSNGYGIWSADNPEVWKILEPILRLASRMLMSIHVMPWFDALLNAPRKRVPDSRLHSENQGEDGLEYIELGTFKPSGNEALASQRDRAFERLRTTFGYQLGFMISSEHPAGPEAGALDSLGLTFENHSYMLYDPATNKSWRSFTFINIIPLEQLLRDGLNTAERLMIEWSVAETIAHEVMHAVAALSTSLVGLVHVAEPYFEDEALSEVGYVFESIINSGLPGMILNKPGCLPLGYFLQRIWPSYIDAESRNPETPILKDPGPHTYQEYFPIPISFYEDMQQESFWSVVRQFGNSPLNYRTIKEGLRMQYTVTDLVEGEFTRKCAGRFTETDPIKIVNGNFRSDVEGLRAAINWTPEERTALEFGIALVNSADAQERFWNLGVQQRKAIQGVMNTMTFYAKPATSPLVNPHIFSLTKQAITHHGNMVIALREQEAQNKTLYTDRRAKLLAWNQGTREFMRELIRQDSAIDSTVEEFRLEQCRMYLWNPSDVNTRSGKDWLEIQILQNARQEQVNGNQEQCRIYCTRLIGEDWRSVFGEASARAMLLAPDKDVSTGYPERLLILQGLARIVTKILDNAPDIWKAEVRALQDNVHETLNSMLMQGPKATTDQEIQADQGSQENQGGQGNDTAVAPQISDPSTVADLDAMEE